MDKVGDVEMVSEGVGEWVSGVAIAGGPGAMPYSRAVCTSNSLMRTGPGRTRIVASDGPKPPALSGSSSNLYP